MKLGELLNRAMNLEELQAELYEGLARPLKKWLVVDRVITVRN